MELYRPQPWPKKPSQDGVIETIIILTFSQTEIFPTSSDLWYYRRNQMQGRAQIWLFAFPFLGSPLCCLFASWRARRMIALAECAPSFARAKRSPRCSHPTKTTE
jgi:hypothetical protein